MRAYTHATANLNETRVDKMADKSVIGELKAEMQLPNLDLDVLVMGQYQLLGKPDLPKNVDLADT